jgi:hypothetical protein
MFWFPPYFVIRFAPILVRSEESFVSPDPWNGGAQARFTVEVYKLAPKNWNRAAAAQMGKLLGGDLFNIRSDGDGRSHRLPESLVELWHTKRLTTEELPRLLHGLQPSLRESDYFPILHHRRLEWTGAIFALFCLGMVIFSLTVIPGDAPGGARKIGTFGFGLLGLATPLGFVGFTQRQRNRRHMQMEWILANLPLPVNDARAANLPAVVPSKLANPKPADPPLDEFYRGIAAFEQLMEDWLQDNGCPCRFPRFRATVERETDIFGASMGTWEQQTLIRLIDRRLRLVGSQWVREGREGECPRCGAVIRRWEVEERRDQVMDHMRVVPRAGVEDLGAPVDGALPRCSRFFGTNDKRALRDAEVQYPVLPLADWIAWMSERQTAPATRTLP